MTDTSLFPHELEGLAAGLVAAMPRLSPRHQRTAVALYRLLALGDPVEPAALAARAELTEDETRDLLDRWPGVYREDGRVVGFWGLALDRMPHRLVVDGRELRAWCAWDTLFLPELLGRPARVESRCPQTGDAISLDVLPDQGAANMAPTTAVLSFLGRDEPFDVDTIVSFCHFVHFFRDREAATAWISRRPGAFMLAVEAGFELGRIVNRGRFGAALDQGGGPLE